MVDFGMMNDFIDKFYQELKGENEEVLNRLVHSYKDEISKIIWKNTPNSMNCCAISSPED